MMFSAQQLAALVGARIVGNPEQAVRSFAKIEEAQAHDLCFLANAKYAEYLNSTQAGLILISEALVPSHALQATLLVVPDAYAAFAQLMQIYEQMLAGQNKKTGIEQPSVIDPSAQIGKDVYIGAFVYIGAGSVIGNGTRIYPGTFIGDGVHIGANSLIHAGVKIYHGSRLGERVIIHAGTVIGSDGFGFALENGAFKKIPQLGFVHIDDDVEIGANTTIDRATMGQTRIGKGTKLDNLIQIAHNVDIGQHTVVASQAGISGSTKIGNYCQIGGQAGIVGHIRIADQSRINAQSGVAKAVTQPGSALTGSPAFDYHSALKSQVVYKHLPDLEKRVRQLEQQLQQLLAASSVSE
jgi:UDP-3-O-[3-hydroxymyristoyl] glucosamine N-acyltransferase